MVRVHFVVRAAHGPGALNVRAKHYRAHRIHLDQAGDHGVSVITAGTLVAEDGETPGGSLFVLEAPNRASIDAFTRGDPYRVNGVGAKGGWALSQKERLPGGRLRTLPQVQIP